MPGVTRPHPSIEHRSLIWWAGDRGTALLNGLDPEVVGTVALSQGLVARNGAFVAEVRRKRGLGLMLDGEAWRAQLPVDHPARTPSFHALEWVERSAVHCPADWTTRTLEDFAESYIDGQVGLATLLTTPGHHDFEPVGALRRRDLELASLCADHVRDRALREPRPDDRHRHRQQLLATLLLRAGRLDDASTAWLVAAYGSLDVDGYLVWAVDFSASQIQTARLLALARALQTRTGRPVVLAGIGHLWQAALAGGVAGALFGQRSALRWPDESLRRPAASEESDEEDDGWGVAVYHGDILGAVRIGRPGEAKRRRLCLRHPCPCGHHPAGSPPADQRSIRAHNQWWTMKEARQVCATNVGHATHALVHRACWRRRSTAGAPATRAAEQQPLNRRCGRLAGPAAPTRSW